MTEPTDSTPAPATPTSALAGTAVPDNVVRVAFGAARPIRADACPRAAEKLAAFTRLVDAGMVLVHLDTRVPGARVPPQYAGDVQLGLNFSHRFGLGDFVFDDVGVRASLSFQGQPFFCDVPWSAVFMMRSYVTDDVALFTESMPRELARLLQQADSEERATAESEPAPAPAEVGDAAAASGALAADELPATAPATESPATAPSAESAPRAFGLRLVKSE